jgi:hypothetical protein
MFPPAYNGIVGTRNATSLNNIDESSSNNSKISPWQSAPPANDIKAITSYTILSYYAKRFKSVPIVPQIVCISCHAFKPLRIFCNLRIFKIWRKKEEQLSQFWKTNFPSLSQPTSSRNPCSTSRWDCASPSWPSTSSTTPSGTATAPC